MQPIATVTIELGFQQPRGKKTDQRRRRQIKLFLQRQRPGHRKPNPLKVLDPEVKVLHEEKISGQDCQAAATHVHHGRKPASRQADYHRIGEDQQKMYGQNAVNAPEIERREKLGGFARFQQNPPDQKAGKDKKQIDAGPAQPENLDEISQGGAARAEIRGTEIMKQDYAQHREAAQASSGMRCEEDGEAGITAAEPLTLVVAEVIESCEISSEGYYIKDLPKTCDLRRRPLTSHSRAQTR